MGKKKKKKQRGSEQQTTRPLSGTIIPPVGPMRAVTSQSLVPLRTAARTQSQTPLRLWAVRTLAEDSTPTFPAKPVPQYSLSPSRTQEYSPSPSRTQGQYRDLALGRIQVQRTLRVGVGSFGFEYSKAWAPRRLDITLPNGARLQVDGLTTDEIGQLLRLLKLSTLRQTGSIQSDPRLGTPRAHEHRILHELMRTAES